MPKVFHPSILLSTSTAVLVLSPIYYEIAHRVRPPASLPLIFAFTSVMAAAILAGYELLFAVQEKSLPRKARILHVGIDDRIPFLVHWVWVYGFLYYGLLGLPLAFLTSIRQCFIFLMGGFGILLLSSSVFLLWPTVCPPQWRRYPRIGVSARFLAFIQRFDNGRGCFPSLHCALSAYTATFIPSEWIVVAVPFVVCLSCLFVKQHSVLELPGSLAFGFLIGILVHTLI